jgi:L-fuculose-phosphate aldolase
MEGNRLLGSCRPSPLLEVSLVTDPSLHSREAVPLLVDAIRMLTRADMMDHSGHGSARRDAGSFYINSGASVRGSLTERDIVAVDLDGVLIEGSAQPPLEFPLHAEIYRARPDVHAVMHTHPRWSTFLTMVGAPYQPVFGQGALLGDVPVMDSPMSVNSRQMGERLVATLGHGHAVLLKSHGAAIVGANVVEAFVLAAYIEENAYRQYMAMQIGSPYVFSDAERQICRQRLWTASLFQKVWEHYRSKLA